MPRTAVVAGVGPGLGESLARTFAAEGCRVGLLARSADDVRELAADLPTDALAVPTDLREPEQVRSAFDEIRESLGSVDVLVNNASAGSWKGLRDCSVEEFQRAWAVNGRGAFVASKEAAGDMLDGEDPGGTIIFTGATSAVRGRGGAIGFSSAKFAARGMAEDMARELGPEGIHVAHVIVDGQILPPDPADRPADRSEETYLDPDEIAQNYWHLVEQDRSAWTLELDLRPHVEEF